MSAQGGSARTRAASGNGQQPKRPAEKETFDESRDTSPAQGRPFPAKDDSKPTSPPPPQQQHPQQQPEGNDTVRIRPSLATEAPPPPAVELPKKKSSGAGARLPRKAHLVLRRVEPWSAMKFSFVVSLVCFVVLFVAVAVLYGVLSALGVFDSIVDLVNQLGQGEQGQNSIPIDIASWFEPVRILGYTALIGAVNVVLITALATLGAVIYNVASDLVGGVEVTFSEAE
ncbi:DUF3566 domain-containing protein [Nonomuraea diastatica]|uniref:DUF3566 domain-containing protein n=1 Tax=Nonomuraea diastatica TaxID=1848329 RepID=A0A4R4WHW9_9ACTN|nr:DUF3566 domain-containing protein [Nonomuraea diastatica]TDD17961.1 DUF3566 domain-containing protein [Nonomuraea diastatica]